MMLDRLLICVIPGSFLVKYFFFNANMSNYSLNDYINEMYVLLDFYDGAAVDDHSWVVGDF